MEEYANEWKSIDEASNVNEKPYMEFILPQKYAELRQEMHQQLDQQMREEHELLRQARCKELRQRYNKPKLKRARKRNAGKLDRKGKSRHDPDLTADQSIDSLVAELVEKGILIDAPRKSLEEFIGDYNYLAYEMRTTGNKS